ncbi:MAG: transcription-repair coupling factor [Anaerolineales bacterium]|nr:transcription-repair coupling factor [Anaerolineales bacterium]
MDAPRVLIEQIRSLPVWQTLCEALRKGPTHLVLRLPRAARLPVAAALREEFGVPLVLVTERADRAIDWLDESAFWFPQTPRCLFPEPAPLFYEQAEWGGVTRRERLRALTALAVYHLPGVSRSPTPPLLVTSARALMVRTLPRREFLKASHRLRPGSVYAFDALVRAWQRMGYQRVEVVLESGQFSRRGGILDIWPPAEPYPVRLDFFGDQLETLRCFDPTSQRTLKTLDEVLVTPACEFLLPERVEEEDRFSEFHLPLLHPYASSLFDYLPKEALVLVEDMSLFASAVTEVEEQAVRLRTDLVANGLLAEDFPVPYFTWDELHEALQSHRVAVLGYSHLDQAIADEAIATLASEFVNLERFAGRLKSFLEYLERETSAGRLAIVVTRQAARLRELWREHIELAHIGERRWQAGTVEILEASLSGGWRLGETLLLTDAEIFGWERPRPRPPLTSEREAPELAYADLQPGDWVVHVDYGIGRFVGLIRRTLEGVEREYLCVEYKNGDQVFIPIHQADRLTRYIGADGTPPSLAHLGSQEWNETKQRVRQAVQEVARELLELYARRQVARGHAFQPDTPWQQELEGSFPYVETPDQIQALEQIKRDMESPRPMDRLLCGDVGYGKTEVALRAAFKAVMDGKQVAILVPTTVLAQQHYETFKQRLATFPVNVEMLSRFRSPKEQEQILQGLATGAVDIVIGTHRLLSSDVHFRDLGLVIIDEEQRFGVTHKEHLKKLRTEVDVLTLTATPIPRTLYMALTGVRDISMLNTPPDERLPIVTHVGPYSPQLVRQAILRELERGGQVFFVHNRVQTIGAMKLHLQKLVPEARIAVAHGKMPEAELASVMRRFTAGEVDVLLSTSIIESGLDIPNANTLIVDRADTFGLAQLYQLRGRVGRGAARAYCYFFRHRKLRPTPEGQERLEIIAENTQLGAGYSIAMRDLEMRGAGELLGTRQSGHIAAVGFHLYTRMLAAAVRNLRRAQGLPSPASEEAPFLSETGLPVAVELPLPASIPESYVSDPSLRLRLYRRLADIQDEGMLQALQEEFVDRFGPLPEPVRNLFYQLHIKLLAERAGLSSVSMENGQIVLRYPWPETGDKESVRLPDFAPDVRGGKNAYWCTFAKSGRWQERLLEVLGQLAQSPLLRKTV